MAEPLRFYLISPSVFALITYIIMPSFHSGHAIKSWIDHPLIDIHLIECIAKMPTDIFTDHILNRILGFFKKTVYLFYL